MNDKFLQVKSLIIDLILQNHTIKDQREQRYILAKNGIGTDRVSEMDGYNTIVDIINEGLLPERYEEWKHHPRAGVREMANPKAEYLTKFIDKIDGIHRGYWVPQTEAYELKLAALQKPLTMLEKTLPREQLKAMGNPHWTDGLTAVEILRYLD